MNFRAPVTQLYTITLLTPEQGRLDQILQQHFKVLIPELSRTRLQSLMASGCVHHNGVALLKNAKHASDGTYTLILDDPTPSLLCATPMDLDIVFEDEDLIVLNKPAGLTVHPGAGTDEHTLVHGLLYHCKDHLSGIGGVQRPGIVHRLDKDTSGLMVVAKHDAAHQHLSKQFETRTLSRTYDAFVWGRPSPLQGCLHTYIGRHPQNRQKMKAMPIPNTPHTPPHGVREAITVYQTQRTWDVSCDHEHVRHALKVPILYSWVSCTLKTGRTHQIRVHMSMIQCPIIGDPTYGKARVSQRIPSDFLNLTRQALHASRISFIHPRHECEMTFTCDLPQDLKFLMRDTATKI